MLLRGDGQKNPFTNSNHAKPTKRKTYHLPLPPKGTCVEIGETNVKHSPGLEHGRSKALPTLESLESLDSLPPKALEHIETPGRGPRVLIHFRHL